VSEGQPLSADVEVPLAVHLEGASVQVAVGVQTPCLQQGKLSGHELPVTVFSIVQVVTLLHEAIGRHSPAKQQA